MKKLDPDIQDALDEFILKVGHKVLRELYNLNRHLRNRLQCDKIPIHTMYQLSLFKEMESGEYPNLTVSQLAEQENLNKRTAYNLHKRYYEYKQEKVKLRVAKKRLNQNS